MKPRKSTILIVLLGLMLVAFAAGMAQSTTPSEQKKQSETCRDMDSCCCKGDSCPMKEEGAASADAKDGCCCCSGDSCDMKMKEDMKHHSTEHEGCCSGDSCDMKMKHDMKSHPNEGACCNMKHKDTKSKTKQKPA